jgi:hypothetical protein
MPPHFNPEDGGNIFLQNIGIHMPYYMASWNTDWWSSNAQDSYSRGPQFKSQLEHSLSWLRSSWFCRVSPGKCCSASIRPQLLPSKSFPIHHYSSIIQAFNAYILSMRVNQHEIMTDHYLIGELLHYMFKPKFPHQRCRWTHMTFLLYCCQLKLWCTLKDVLTKFSADVESAVK